MERKCQRDVFEIRLSIAILYSFVLRRMCEGRISQEDDHCVMLMKFRNDTFGLAKYCRSYMFDTSVCHMINVICFNKHQTITYLKEH